MKRIVNRDKPPRAFHDSCKEADLRKVKTSKSESFDSFLLFQKRAELASIHEKSH